MKHKLKQFFITVLLLAVFLYLGDYLILRFRIWRNLQPYGTVTVQITYAISEKSTPGINKTEYSSTGPQDQTCVNSIFPHQSYTPCWYLRRHPEKQIKV